MNKIDTRFIINNGLKEIAANAVEWIVDKKQELHVRRICQNDRSRGLLQ